MIEIRPPLSFLIIIKKNMLKTQLKIYLIIGAIFIIGLILGYIWGSNQGLKQGKKEVEEKYQSKIEELYPTPPEPEEVFSFSGEIKEIKDKTLTVETPLPAANPFEEPKTEIKTVGITKTTEFVKAAEKSREEIAEERVAILEAQKENSKLEISPLELYKKEVPILFSDFKVGDTIVAETDENIKGKTEFTAKTIMLVISQSGGEQNNQ